LHKEVGFDDVVSLIKAKVSNLGTIDFFKKQFSASRDLLIPE